MPIYTVSVPTDASGDGSVSTPLVHGFLQSISVSYVTTTISTVTVTESGGGARELLDASPANTNATTYNPQYPVHGSDGAAISDVYTWAYLEGRPLVVSVTGADADTDDAVTVTIITR
jgi:hypothetical protein